MPSTPRIARVPMLKRLTTDDLIALLELDHDGLSEPLRFSDHATERITGDRIGTRSRALSPPTLQIYDFAMVATERPDDDEAEILPVIPITLENVVSDLGPLLQFPTEDFSARFVEVLKSSPDTIVREYTVLKVANQGTEGDNFLLQLSLDPIVREPSPFMVCDPQRTPGLFGG